MISASQGCWDDDSSALRLRHPDRFYFPTTAIAAAVIALTAVAIVGAGSGANLAL
jgi:hypothetical protein